MSATLSPALRVIASPHRVERSLRSTPSGVALERYRCLLDETECASPPLARMPARVCSRGRDPSLQEYRCHCPRSPFRERPSQTASDSTQSTSQEASETRHGAPQAALARRESAVWQQRRSYTQEYSVCLGFGRRLACCSTRTFTMAFLNAMAAHAATVFPSPLGTAPRSNGKPTRPRIPLHHWPFAI